VAEEFPRGDEAEIPEWGFSGSALIHGANLILNIGQNGAAFEKATGKLVWKSEADTAGYSTPHLITVNGKEQVVLSTRRAYKGRRSEQRHRFVGAHLEHELRRERGRSHPQRHEALHLLRLQQRLRLARSGLRGRLPRSGAAA
jgi:hypothetical protein